MSQVINPIWVTDPNAYRAKMAALVGSRDPLTVMAETADVLARIVREHATAQMLARPFEGKWTPNEIIGHLIDAEWVYGYRVRQILSEDDPPIMGMDQDLWVAAQRYNEREPSDLVETFRTMRGFNLTLWRIIREVQLDRCGQHNERGPESLRTMRTMLAGHDLWHIDQIMRYLAEIKRR